MKKKNKDKKVSWFNGISTFVGYLMPKKLLLKNSKWCALTLSCRDKDISPIVNVIA